MSKTIAGVALSVVTAAAVGAGSYGLVAVNEWRIAQNDQRYVTQEAWIEDANRRELRALSREINALRVKQESQGLSPVEHQRLLDLESDKAEIRGR